MQQQHREYEEVIRQMEDFLNIVNKGFCHEGKAIWNTDGTLNEGLKSRISLIGQLIGDSTKKVNQN